MIVSLLMILLAAQDPPVEQTKKNIKVLTGLPSSQLIPSMAFMANSLGVTCAHCHVPKTYEADDKPAKQVARAHLTMTRAINEQHFGGKLVVTCNSCHQGHVQPPATPLVANAAWHHVATPPPALPDAAAIIRKAVVPAALADAKGTVERFNGRDEPVSGEFTIAERKFETQLSYPPEANSALRLVALDAYSNWKTVATENGAVVVEGTPRNVIPSGVEGSGREGNNARTTRPDPSTNARDDKTERFWFHAKTGALLRRQRITRTPLGDLPEEIEYTANLRRWSRADYRVTFTFAPAASGGSARQ